MKPSFSPWLPFGALIAIAAALYAFVERDTPLRLSLGASAANDRLTPNGIVRALRGAEPAIATVVLRSGSTVDARVAPGCFVQIGDRVFVRDANENGERLVFAVHH